MAEYFSMDGYKAASLSGLEDSRANCRSKKGEFSLQEISPNNTAALMYMVTTEPKFHYAQPTSAMSKKYNKKKADSIIDTSFTPGKYKLPNFKLESSATISAIRKQHKDWKLEQPPDYKEHADFQRRLKYLHSKQQTNNTLSLTNIRQAELNTTKYTSISRKNMAGDTNARFDLLDQVESNLSKLRYPLKNEPKTSGMLPDPENHSYFFPMVREASQHMQDRRARGVVASPFKLEAILAEAKEDYKQKRINIFGRLGEVLAHSQKGPFKTMKTEEDTTELFQGGPLSPRQDGLDSYMLTRGISPKGVVTPIKTNPASEIQQPKFRSYLQYRLTTDSSVSATKSRSTVQVPPLRGFQSTPKGSKLALWQLSGQSPFKSSSKVSKSLISGSSPAQIQAAWTPATSENPEQVDSLNTENLSIQASKVPSKQIPKAIFKICHDSPEDGTVSTEEKHKQILKEVILANIVKAPPSESKKEQQMMLDGYLESIRQLKREFGYSTVTYISCFRRIS
jgi:hypothetical protein